jgi:3-methyladenine DNA glycosylase/8-oxoguanine DNA glycosylase
VRTDQPENEYLFLLRFRAPYHWDGMLAFLAKRVIPGVEAVEQGTYRRSISLNGRHGYFEVSLQEGADALAVRIQFPDPCSLFFIVERIRAMFDLGADWVDIARTLKSDPALAERVRSAPGLRVPGCWDGFELATRAIVGQVISVGNATTIAGRIAKKLGKPLAESGKLTHLFPTPEILAVADLSAVGLTKARAETIRTLARAVCEGRIRFEGIVETDAFLAFGNWGVDRAICGYEGARGAGCVSGRGFGAAACVEFGEFSRAGTAVGGMAAVASLRNYVSLEWFF